ncbi:hypothetical protein AYI69_g5798 [Smittium culicis]|uniref:Uncharacterized protein n=1 Tax=Smittium culicis TaxID=133412 RepID=A0A1R1Y3L6_9FUNG|nr:hypothetical protein AYI69_g5798 [Smittium culicis]
MTAPSGVAQVGQNSTNASAIPATAAAGVANVGFTSLIASKPPQAANSVQFQTILVSTIPAASKTDAVGSVINDISKIISPSPVVSSRGGNVGDATVTSMAGSSDNSGDVGVGGGAAIAAAGGAAAVAAAAGGAAPAVTITATDSNGNQVVQEVVPVQQPSATSAAPAPVSSPPTVSIVSSSAQSDAASNFSLNTSFSSLVFALSLAALLI